MTHEFQISRSSIKRIIKNDLLLKHVKRGYTFKISEQVKQKRETRCRRLLNRFRARDQIEKIWFTDEKIFTLSGVKNSQNDQIRIPRPSRKADIPLHRLLKEREKFSSYLMVSAAISRNHKVDLIFIDQGVRLDSRSYCQRVLSHLLPEIERLTPDYTFMQVILLTCYNKFWFLQRF